ncbi:DDE transposase family protein [Streptomyces sp. NRRL S-244]|uniref:DDE transposase family protein n=1 Tax=Streptomyces sp. NRRL S-244 TaxID=1463897 RepID=UPI0004BED7BE|nr:DDE transposase family protein [Streptomyces sp. NRRL S-244]
MPARLAFVLLLVGLLMITVLVISLITYLVGKAFGLPTIDSLKLSGRVAVGMVTAGIAILVFVFGAGAPLTDTNAAAPSRTATHWHTNLMTRQLAPLFGVSESTADRTSDPSCRPSAFCDPRTRTRSSEVRRYTVGCSTAVRTTWGERCGERDEECGPAAPRR